MSVLCVARGRTIDVCRGGHSHGALGAQMRNCLQRLSIPWFQLEAVQSRGSMIARGSAVVSLPPPPPLPGLVAPDIPQPPEPPGIGGVDGLLQAVRMHGAKRTLRRHWGRVESMQREGAFNYAQVAELFELCGDLTSLDPPRWGHRPGMKDDFEVPLSIKLVQLFSNFVCEHIPELTAEQVTMFVKALTPKVRPMDEFWLFMLAKQVQDTAERYSPEQINVIAKRYAAKGLEDDEFFEALCRQVINDIDNFRLEQLASVLMSCAKIRFLHEELCSLAYPLFEEPDRVHCLDGETLASAVASAALLDWRPFKMSACLRQISIDATHLRRILAWADIITGLVLAEVHMPSRERSLALMPKLVHQVQMHAEACSTNSSHRREMSLIQRRVALLGIGAVFGVPHGYLYPTSVLQSIQNALTSLEKHLGTKPYEPSSSSFHLEVDAVLNLLEVDHSIEHHQSPFCLDIVISPLQMSRVDLSVHMSAKVLEKVYQDSRTTVCNNQIY